MSEDLIRRQAAIETAQRMYEGCDGDIDDYRDLMVESLKVLPSAEPERKMGKWIEFDNSHCECPFCHSEWSYFENMVEYFEFCPHCGADMRGEQE